MNSDKVGENHKMAKSATASEKVAGWKHLSRIVSWVIEAIVCGSHYSTLINTPFRPIRSHEVKSLVHQTLFFPSQYKRRKAIWLRETRIAILWGRNLPLLL